MDTRVRLIPPLRLLESSLTPLLSGIAKLEGYARAAGLDPNSVSHKV